MGVSLFSYTLHHAVCLEDTWVNLLLHNSVEIWYFAYHPEATATDTFSMSEVVTTIKEISLIGHSIFERERHKVAEVIGGLYCTLLVSDRYPLAI